MCSGGDAVGVDSGRMVNRARASQVDAHDRRRDRDVEPIADAEGEERGGDVAVELDRGVGLDHVAFEEEVGVGVVLVGVAVDEVEHQLPAVEVEVVDRVVARAQVAEAHVPFALADGLRALGEERSERVGGAREATHRQRRTNR